MIYNFCLAPGLICPLTANYDCLLPGLPLLRTCKAILKEARCEIYKNTFIVSDWQEADVLYEACLQERRLMVKSLELRFGSYELTDDHKLDVKYEVEEDFPSEAFQQYGPQASSTMERVRRREIHARLKDTVRTDPWRGKMSRLLGETELEHLRLDLTECYCHLRCCDLYYNAFWTFAPGFWSGTLPNTMELVGVPETQMERLRKDWVAITAFGTLTNSSWPQARQELIEPIRGLDLDEFMEKIRHERENPGEA